MNSLFKKIFLYIIILAVAAAICPFSVQAGRAAKPLSAKENIKMKKLTAAMMIKIYKSTPAEPRNSDLKLIHGAVRLATRRLPQGCAYDGTYWYYLSNLSFYGKGHSDLRLTRVKYQKNGTYQSDYMTLKGFGHGTNLDCSVYGGKTWLWTGSDPGKASGSTTTISCFSYKKGSVLKKHAKIRYRIPRSDKKGYAGNCFPAVDPKSRRLAVRYTGNGKQHFLIYRLKKGRYIDRKRPVRSISLAHTRGDFQGFDIAGKEIITIEGTASRTERKELHKTYHPIVIRKYNYSSGKRKNITVSGAKKLSHREPEGIQVNRDGKILFGLASHYKNEYTCMNIYQLK